MHPYRSRRSDRALLLPAVLAALAALAPHAGAPAAVPLAPADREAAHFAPCAGPVRVSCVVDGDTFWYRGARIRVADINAPETGEPRCPREAALADRATRRFTALLNAGRFTLAPIARATDVYGRRLFVVTRAGASLGLALVSEGLAERWKGYRGDWC
jgi:endonuclease YncB( thermonuclease family)